MSIEPVAYPIPEFCTRYGCGRSTAYELIGAGKLLAKKIGRRTVIDAESASRWYAAIPSAPIGGDTSRRGAA